MEASERFAVPCPNCQPLSTCPTALSLRLSLPPPCTLPSSGLAELCGTGRPDPVPLLLVLQLYSELRSENERLREALTETTLRLAQLKVELERATQVRC